MCNSGFTNLHAHSFYSVQDALPSPEQLILGAKKSDNFIVASGEAHTVREFIEAVFSFFNINYKK
jgi:GDP-D-mannose dehydratase